MSADDPAAPMLTTAASFRTVRQRPDEHAPTSPRRDVPCEPDTRLANIAALLAGWGLLANSPSEDEPLPGEPDTGYISVHNPANGQYAEVSVEKFGSDPSEWFLGLQYWTLRSEDPDGRQMARAVHRMLSDSGDNRL